MGPTFKDLFDGVKRGGVLPTLLVMSLLLLALSIGLALVLVLVTPECAQWEETGGMTCITVGEGVTQCNPNLRCVRYVEE